MSFAGIQYDESKHPRGAGGRFSSTGGSSDKQSRAVASHKPSTKAKQDLATQGERMVAKAIGGTCTKDNEPFDVVMVRGKKKYAIEVKTLVDNKNDKITMHPESLERKLKWARANKAVPYTVVVDMRSGTHQVYARFGVGSFRLAGLTKVKLNDLPGFLK